MSTFFITIRTINNSLITFLENSVVKYSILILLTLLIIIIDKIKINYLELFENDMFKLIYTLLIVYTACFDPIYAIILTTFIIIGIQELHTRKATITITNEIQNDNNITNNNNNNKKTNNNKNNKNNKNNNNNNISINNNELNDNIVFVESKITKEEDNTQSIIYENNALPSETTLTNIKNSHYIINKQSIQKQPEENDGLIVNYDYYEDPAFITLTNNLQNKNRLNKNKFRVNEDDLLKAQTNKLTNMHLKSTEIKLCDIQGYDHLDKNSSNY